MRIVLKNFRIVDENTDITGSVIINDGIISEPGENENNAAMIIDGLSLSSSGCLPVLMPAFVDLHAHFRDPCLFENNTVPGQETPFPSELIESASLAAAAGGFGTVVCMANTRPPIDTIKKAAAIKNRCDTLGLIDLYPVMSLTEGMEGKKLSEITGIAPDGGGYIPLMLSEDGRDLENDNLFLSAMKEAKRTGIPVSCHCDFGGDENSAIRRVIELGKKAGCHIHIAHVSAKEAIETIRESKAAIKAVSDTDGFTLTCEAMPHNLCLAEEDAKKLGEKTWGAVNPPLRTEQDRQALIKALLDGTIDVIATDHAPHSAADKEAGAPGFSGFETAFASLYTELVRGGSLGLKQLSSLMSGKPAELLGFGGSHKKRGRILPGYRADLVIIDTETPWTVDVSSFKSRGKNSPFTGRQLYGKILMTLHSGRVVFER